MSTLSFLHLSAADYGGAGIAAHRMHDGLRQLGHNSRMLVLERRSKDPDVKVVAEGDHFFRFKRIIHKAELRFSSYPDYYFQYQTMSPGIKAEELLSLAGMKPDVIIVHFISNFLSFEDVQSLHKITGAPVLWSLLDMGLLTGGCHYAWQCQGYTQQCGNCPALRHRGDLDASACTLKKKGAALEELPSIVIAGSSTLARQVNTSSLFSKFKIETLLLGVSSEVFSPRPMAELRRDLDIPLDRQLIFFGAQKFSQRRKGMDLLMLALQQLAVRWGSDRQLPVLLSAGNAADFGSLRDAGYKIVQFDTVNLQRLAQCYAAADLFACPSIEDSGPMMINESMMAGTPVVAFDMGVARDLIEHGKNGWIAPLADINAFTQGLYEVLHWTHEAREQARRRAREIALEKCLPAIQLQHLVQIAQDAISLHATENIRNAV